jgi:exopolyphosphatase/guanosine-5'-triphosphate,3'-diphosphate pyrophosphatase|tara:strand:- start:2765 stop:3694 length:930 start_codon:yes stop_codon:yes gene_type:complete
VVSKRRKVAAIDCGTNSTRLLIAEIGDNGQYEILNRRQEVTRLGEGVDATGNLNGEAIDRVLATLMSFREILDAEGIHEFRTVATSAVRDATNSGIFLSAAEGILQKEVELISGRQEAELSFLGATHSVEIGGPYLVFDLGGGSTEFSYGEKMCEQFLSINAGCVRMAERFIHSDPPLPEELSAALSLVELHLIDVEKAIPSLDKATTLIGLAGTVSAIAMIEQGLEKYSYELVHHYLMSHADMEEVFRILVTDNREQRLTNPGMEEDRVDVIVGGVCILIQIMRQFHFTECLVSEADILDGLILRQMN